MRPFVALILALAVLLAACTDGGPSTTSAPAGDGFSVVVSVPMLAALARDVVGDGATVTTLVPPGAEPHEFEVPESEIEAAGRADVLVVVGSGFEPSFEALLAAAGPSTEVFVALQHLERPRTDDAGSVDPHFWHDPVQTAAVVEDLGRVVAGLRPDQAPDIRRATQGRARELRRLSTEIGATVEAVPEARRGLVTQHDFLGYFADRYGFEVVATIIPGFSSHGEPTTTSRLTVKRALDEDAVCAVFDPASSAATLSEVVAAEAEHEVAVVPLFADTLLDSETGYDDAVRDNARRIVETLVSC